MTSPLSVMLVDDSAVIRGVLTKMLSDTSQIKIIDSVMNGELAIQSAKKNKPDIVILDIEMPVMDGLTALPQILKASPDTKVIMFSSLTAKGADTTIKALTLGAVECLVKPSSQATQSDTFKNHLLALLKSLYPMKLSKRARDSNIKLAPIGNKESLLTADYSLNTDPLCYQGPPSIVTIGSSTGGPQALFEVCSHLKDLRCPIVITQHMPSTFTTILAQHITEKAGIPTVEGQEGMVLENGKAYVAPGGFHMKLVRDALDVKITLDDGPQINFCKPAVDPMIESAVNIFGNRVLGVILTGMGSDGIGGGKAIAAKRGRLIAQDQETSTVWGMPRAVAVAGVCNEVLPLLEIGPWLRQQCL